MQARIRSDHAASQPKKPNERNDCEAFVINPHEIRAAKTMSLVIGSFMICWFPLAIKNLIDYIIDCDSIFYGKDHIWHTILKNFCYCAVHVNAAIDPVILAYRINDVKSAIQRVLRCQYQSKLVQDTTDMSVVKSSSQSASVLQNKSKPLKLFKHFRV